MRKLTALILLLALSAPAHSQDYDPQHTMLALNMAIVSVNRILTTKSRAVLKEEYSNIINNLSLGNIENDRDMTELYRDMLSIISRKKVAEGYSKMLKSYYEAAEQRRITYALSSISLTQARINSAQHEVSGLERESQAQERLSQANTDSIRSDINRITDKQDELTYSWIGNMAVSCASFFSGNVFAVGGMAWKTAKYQDEYQRLSQQRERAENRYSQAQAEQNLARARKQRLTQQAKDNLEIERTRLSGLQKEMKQDENMLKEELKKSLWVLDAQDLDDCNKLQERLLQSSWGLLRQYKLPDEYRITQSSLTNFYRAVQEQDTQKRARMLRTI